LLLLLTSCQSSTDEAVEAGLALKASYQEAWCAVASDPACESASEACPHTPYATAADCESVVNLAFSDCPGIYEALAESEAAVQACLDQLSTVDCAGGAGPCDGQGNELLQDLDCDVIRDLQARFCRGADTF